MGTTRFLISGDGDGATAPAPAAIAPLQRLAARRAADARARAQAALTRARVPSFGAGMAGAFGVFSLDHPTEGDAR